MGEVLLLGCITSNLTNCDNGDVWQVVLKYTGADLAVGAPPPSAQEQIDMVLKLYKHTLKRAELRDELFAQLLKQTRKNPDRLEELNIHIIEVHNTEWV